MHEHDPLDLSELDPTLDPGHWKAVVETTLSRVETVLARRPTDPITLIASWHRPLILAASIVIALLIPVEMMLEHRETGVEQVRMLVRLSTQTALGESRPTGAELSRVLGNERLP
jgi:hypothetical protein